MSDLTKLHEVINTKRDPKEVSKLEKKQVSPLQNEFMDMAETFKSMKTGEEIEYTCKLCKDKGFIVSDSSDYFIEDTLSKVVDGKIIDIPVYLKKCECRVKKDFEINMNRSGMSAILDKIKNEKYETKFDWQKDYLNRVTEYVKNDVNGFFISGQTGSGKTLLMGKGLLGLIQKGKEGFYFDWHNDFNKKVIDRYKVEDWTFIDYMCNVDVLYIDDLFKTRGNVIEDLYKRDKEIMIARTIIDKRLNSKGKKTIVSMEWKPSDIAMIDSSLHGRMLLMAESNKNWITMTDKENRNIRELKFNNEF